MKEKSAKIIRIITVPPLLVVALIITLYLQNPNIFRDSIDYAVALVFLGLFPVFVYLIWAGKGSTAGWGCLKSGAGWI